MFAQTQSRCRQLVSLESLRGVKVKVTGVHMLMWKNINRFVVLQDSCIPDV